MDSTQGNASKLIGKKTKTEFDLSPRLKADKDKRVEVINATESKIIRSLDSIIAKSEKTTSSLQQQRRFLIAELSAFILKTPTRESSTTFQLDTVIEELAKVDKTLSNIDAALDVIINASLGSTNTFKTNTTFDMTNPRRNTNHEK